MAQMGIRTENEGISGGRALSRAGFLKVAGATVASVSSLGIGATLGGCADSGSSASASTSAVVASGETGGSSAAGTSAGASADASMRAGSSEGDASASSQATTLIAVFSWSGNTLAMAQRIQELDPSAGFFRIETVDPYPDDIDATIDQARQEQDSDYLPALSATVEGWGRYDTVFLGYPIWWYELPPAVKSFIGQYDWSGKTIVPFNSHAGSGDSGTPADIAELCPDSTIAQNLAIAGERVANSLDQVDEWYGSLGLVSA